MLQQTVDEEEKQVICHLMKSFYVDNCVISVDSIEDLQLLQNIATRIMAEGKFDLREWEHTGQEGDESTTSVLGLLWDKINDTLKLTISLIESIVKLFKFTKRNILSATQQIFDPIGVACPVLIKLKFLLQETWDINLIEIRNYRRI